MVAESFWTESLKVEKKMAYSTWVRHHNFFVIFFLLLLFLEAHGCMKYWPHFHKHRVRRSWLGLEIKVSAFSDQISMVLHWYFSNFTFSPGVGSTLDPCINCPLWLGCLRLCGMHCSPMTDAGNWTPGLLSYTKSVLTSTAIYNYYLYYHNNKVPKLVDFLNSTKWFHIQRRNSHEHTTSIFTLETNWRGSSPRRGHCCTLQYSQ